MTAPDDRTHHDPAAEAAARAFEALARAYAFAFERAANAGDYASDGPNYAAALDRENRALAALIAAHAAAVADADAAGYARAMGEVDAACSALAGDDEHESIALWRLAPYGWRAEVATAESCAVGVGQTATAAIIDLLDCDRAAADMAARMDAADPPALVNGGPARDALDDGR